MLRIELRPEIWLSMNFCRVAAFAFGKLLSVLSRAASFASVWPPFMTTNE